MTNTTIGASRQKNLPHPSTAAPSTKAMSNASHKKRSKPNAPQLAMASSKQPETAQPRQDAQQAAKKSASQSPARKKSQAAAPHMPAPRRTITPVKVRRAERRKDINAMKECYEAAQTDLELCSSAPSSSNESEDSDNSSSSKQGQRRRRKTTKTTVPITPSPQDAKKKPLSRESSPNRRRAASVADVYAGPTFNNAPAPSALPMPTFLESVRAHAQPSHSSPHHGLDAISEQEAYRQQSQLIMRMLSVSQQPSSYVPTKMATAHDIVDSRALEIQHGLKAMLKIRA